MQCIHDFQSFFPIMIALTMLVQVLNHPSQYPRYPVIHQASLLQLHQGHSKMLVGFHCSMPQNWNLDHFLHVLFNQCCCLVVLQEEELISDSSHGSCVQWWMASCPGEGLLPPIHWICTHVHLLPSHCQPLRGRCGLRAARPRHGHVLLRQMSGYHATR